MICQHCRDYSACQGRYALFTSATVRKLAACFCASERENIVEREFAFTRYHLL